jgi:3-phosphoinositide dependent protein kinase-1
MLRADNPTLSPDSTFPANLSALSRNASVISTSSSDSGPSPVLTPPRPRPARTFSAPRSQSPQSRTPQVSLPPSYLAQELGMTDAPQDVTRAANSNMNSKARSKSRGRNVAATADDFKFGGLLGEGSYSTVSLPGNQSFADPHQSPR